MLPCQAETLIVAVLRTDAMKQLHRDSLWHDKLPEGDIVCIVQQDALLMLLLPLPIL